LSGDGRVTWRVGPVPAGPAVVVDIDGVLADATARLHHVTTPGRRKDWDAFFAAVPDDPLVEELHRLLDLLHPDLAIILLSGRPARTRDDTVAWLERHHVRWDLLVLRADSDRRPAPAVKQEALAAIAGLGFEARLAVEDDERNAAMFRAAGVPCVQVTPPAEVPPPLARGR
jgi:beta-phosphoglucomutase-like phosphatase (HAD superfamily)